MLHMAWCVLRGLTFGGGRVSYEFAVYLWEPVIYSSDLAYAPSTDPMSWLTSAGALCVACSHFGGVPFSRLLFKFAEHVGPINVDSCQVGELDVRFCCTCVREVSGRHGVGVCVSTCVCVLPIVCTMCRMLRHSLHGWCGKLWYVESSDFVNTASGPAPAAEPPDGASDRGAICILIKEDLRRIKQFGCVGWEHWILSWACPWPVASFSCALRRPPMT